MAGMFGDTFGKSAADISAMGLSSNPYVAEQQIAAGQYNPGASAPLQNTATTGESGLGMRMTDQQASDIFAGMKAGTIDPRIGALQLSQGQVNLYDMARISGQSPEAIQAAAAQNGISIKDVMGSRGVIQQGGLLAGMSLSDAASTSGGKMVQNPDGTFTFQERSQLGTPFHSDSYIGDLTRMGAGIGRGNAPFVPQYGGNPNYANGNQPGQTTKPGAPTTPNIQALPYQPQQGYRIPPSYQQQPTYSPYGNQRGFSGGYGQQNQYGGYGQSMYPYQNYGRQGMFGGNATSRQPYTGYQAYQPYAGNYRNGMFGAPTMNYNMRNRPMQQYSQSWSQNNPYSSRGGMNQQGGGMGSMDGYGNSMGGMGNWGFTPQFMQNYQQQYPSTREPYDPNRQYTIAALGGGY